MKRNDGRRPLAYEQLESKAAPSSILMVVSGDDTGAPVANNAVANNAVANNAVANNAVANNAITALPSPANHLYETDQVLRFVAENTTGGERAHRPATLPSAVQCAAADEMMQQLPAQWESLLVLSFYDDGTEL